MINDSSERRIMDSIKLVADSPSRLRQIDVYRVLEDVYSEGLIADAAEYLILLRPDLVDEINSCFFCLFDSR